MTPGEAERLKARLADVHATVEAHVPEWRNDAAVIVPTVLEARWETPCPRRKDGRHCTHWYDGEGCCYCLDPADPSATADYDEAPKIEAPTTMKDGS